MLEWYQPSGVIRAPVIVILPVSAGARYPLERYFARYFAERGFAVVLVHREPRENITDAVRINAMLRQSVSDNRQALDWIETRPELDKERIAVFGTSMGSMKGVLFAAVDPRVKAAVLGLAGGDVPFILRHSKDGAWRGRGITRQREEYLKKEQVSPAEFERRLRDEIVWNPLALAPSIAAEKVLLILAVCDTVVLFRTGLELRRAMGKPETLVLVSGHYSAVLYLHYIRRAALRFFEKRLR